MSIETVDELVSLLAHPDASLKKDSSLSLPEKPAAFVAPPLIGGGTTAPDLNPQVIFIKAPAAVGKSTLAQYLSATLGAPLLSLNEVKVSTASLSGFISQVSGENPAQRFNEGTLPIIIDGLDEGRIFSTDEHFWEFINSTWTLLKESSAARNAPQLVMLGRSATCEDVFASTPQELTSQTIQVDYFSPEESVELVRLKALADPKRTDALEQNIGPAMAVMANYFEAISRALQITRGQLFVLPQGKSFAGYAPVLTAVARTIAATKNFSELASRLDKNTSADAWQIILDLSNDIMEREREEKVGRVLDAALKEPRPQTAYDAEEQYRLIAALVSGQQAWSTLNRTGLQDDDLKLYRSTAERFVIDSPFVQDGDFANPVMGSIVLAKVLIEGWLQDSDRADSLLAAASTEPFLWRSVRALMAGKTNASPLVEGVHLGYLMESLQVDLDTNPEAASKLQLDVHSDEPGLAAVTVTTADSAVQLQAQAPFRLYARATGATVNVPDDTVQLWGQDGAHFSVTESSIVAESLEVQANSLSVRGQVWLAADVTSTSPRLRLELEPAAKLGGPSSIMDQYPWNQVEHRLTASPLNPVAEGSYTALLRDAATRFANAGALTFGQGYTYVDQRMDWAIRRYGHKLATLAAAMEEAGLATSSPQGAQGSPKINFHLNSDWKYYWQLATGEEGTSEASDFQALLKQLPS